MCKIYLLQKALCGLQSQMYPHPFNADIAPCLLVTELLCPLPTVLPLVSIVTFAWANHRMTALWE